MVQISEFRIVLPLSTDEYKRGQRYANWKTNEANTSEGQGGQLLSSSPYVHEQWGPGFYQHSLYRLGDRLPEWVMRLVPKNALVIDEKSWICYPWSRSIMTIPFFNKFSIEVLSMHEDNAGTKENVHGLSPEELSIRKVDFVDITMDKVLPQDYKPELDPCKYVSKKTGRGPLAKGWQASAKPVMCAYKLVKAEANYWGIQSRIEKLTVNGIRQVFLLTHRNAFCLTDEWYSLPYEQVLAMEIAGRRKLSLRQQPPPDEASLANPPPSSDSTEADVASQVADNGAPPAATSADESARKPGVGSADATTSDASSLGGGEESDESDVDQEFFEAEMELAASEDEEWRHLAASHSSGNGPRVPHSSPFVTIPGSIAKAAPSPTSVLNNCEKCEVCESSGRPQQTAEVLCDTCGEVFCWPCFNQIHVTPRLKAHRRRQLGGTSASRSIDFRPPTEKPDPADPDDGHPPPPSPSSKLSSPSAKLAGGSQIAKVGYVVVGLKRANSFAFHNGAPKANQKETLALPLLPLDQKKPDGDTYAMLSEPNKVADARGQVAEFERPRHSSHGWLHKGRSVVLNALPSEIDVGCLPVSSRVEALPHSPTLESTLGKSEHDRWQNGFPSHPNEVAEEMVRTMATIFNNQALSGLRPPHHNSDRSSSSIKSVSPSLSRTPSSLSASSPSHPPPNPFRSDSASLFSPHASPHPHPHQPFAHNNNNEDPETAHLHSHQRSPAPTLPHHATETDPIPSNYSRSNTFPSNRNNNLSPSSTPHLIRKSPHSEESGPCSPRPNSNYSSSPMGSFSSFFLGGSPRFGYRFSSGGGLSSPRRGDGSMGWWDPYGLHEEDPLWTGPCGAYAGTTDVGWVSGARDSLTGQASLIAKYMGLVEQLRDVDLRGLSHEYRLAFWINVYNALLMHAYLTFGIPGRYLKRMSLMFKSAYIIGGKCFTALSIEHLMLRARSHRPSLAGILPIQKYRAGDERLLWALDRPEPLVTFALCCGTRSSPALHVYTGKGIREELESSAREFCRVAVGFNKTHNAQVPKLIHWYAKDFSSDARTLLEWIATQLPEAQQLAIRQKLANTRGHGSRAMHVVPYDWTFRYLLPADTHFTPPPHTPSSLHPPLADKNH